MKRLKKINNGSRNHISYVRKNVLKYYKDAVRIAKSINMSWISVEDRVSIALIALVQAVKYFDRKNFSNVSFRVYLYRSVYNALQQEIDKLKKVPLADSVRIKNQREAGQLIRKYQIVQFASPTNEIDYNNKFDIENLMVSDNIEYGLEIKEFISLLKKRLNARQNKVFNLMVDLALLPSTTSLPVKLDLRYMASKLGCSKQNIHKIVKDIRKEAQYIMKYGDNELFDVKTTRLKLKNK